MKKIVTAINDCCVESECCASVHLKKADVCSDLDHYVAENYYQIIASYIGLIAFELALIGQAIFLARNYGEAEKVKLYWRKCQFIEEAAEFQRYRQLNEEQTQ